MANSKESNYYSNLLAQQKEIRSGWQLVQTMYRSEVLQSRGARLAYKSEEDLHYRLKGREVVSKTLAAELFLDRVPPEIIIAKSELELHDHLRERNPSQEPRLSGEIVYSVDNGPKFFLLDKFMINGIGGRDPAMLAEAGKAAEFLLEQGYVPVDAEFIILPLPEKK